MVVVKNFHLKAGLASQILLFKLIFSIFQFHPFCLRYRQVTQIFSEQKLMTPNLQIKLKIESMFFKYLLNKTTYNKILY